MYMMTTVSLGGKAISPRDCIYGIVIIVCSAHKHVPDQLISVATGIE